MGTELAQVLAAARVAHGARSHFTGLSNVTGLEIIDSGQHVLTIRSALTEAIP